MTKLALQSVPSSSHRLRQMGIALALVFGAITSVPLLAHGQTFSVVYSFHSEGQTGFYPTSGVTVDGAGNLYGTTGYGGPGSSCYLGCGVAFKLARHGSSWLFTPLYSFLGNEDGGNPNGLVIGPDGSLFGTTTQGGGSGCLGSGCGTVFSLRPPQHASSRILAGWSETVLYRFAGGNDGAMPEAADLVFDQAGNLYGTTYVGGGSQCMEDCGTVYELTPSNGSWTENILHIFGAPGDGDEPYAGVIFDVAGNLYGTTATGGAHRQGSVYQLLRSGAGWTERLLYSFQGASDGQYPFASLIMDQAGNLYGNTCCSGPSGGGTAFMLTAENWGFNLLFALGAPGTGQGPEGGFVMDSSGNLMARRARVAPTTSVPCSS
jgi:uncharacterized repeat protein (TIGR03803 family)